MIKEKQKFVIDNQATLTGLDSLDLTSEIFRQKSEHIQKNKGRCVFKKGSWKIVINGTIKADTWNIKITNLRGEGK